MELETCAAIIEMQKHSRLSKSEISRRLSRSETFLTSSLQRGGSMRADLLAQIADICDFELVLVSKNDSHDPIVILPSKAEEA